MARKHAAIQPAPPQTTPRADLGLYGLRRGEQAIALFQEADTLDGMTRVSPGDGVVYSAEARLARSRADALLEPMRPPSTGAGEAVTWDDKSDEATPGAHSAIIETLEHPNAISAGASSQRMHAALQAGILAPATDAAVSADAGNSLEKMLCHQLAGAHFSGMRLLEQAANPKLQPGEVARFTNAAARMMDVYQAGCLALLKMKTQGRQHVVVQYQQVNVASGGQAVVAGKIRPRARGLRRKSVDEPHGCDSPGAALWRAHSAEDTLSQPGDEEWPVSDAWRQEYWSADARGAGAQPTCELETRGLFTGDAETPRE